MILQEVERTAVVAVDRAGFVAAEIDRAPALIVRSDTAQVVNLSRDAVVQSRVERTLIHVAGGNQGPPGIPGPVGGQTLQATAGAVLGGHRAIYIDDGRALYAGPSDPSAERVAGITLGAAAENEIVSYQTSGEIAEPSWSWDEGPVFLGLNGTLTQTPPNAGAFIQLGIATEPTKLIVRIGPPIFLQ